ncbi:GNAT family N-acetyltransferase [Massilia sp. W12]|uniref:GNAT family N-acetyltransferase n=1 Tax=Massilia sp. W12 TaxID=3126507 RepID=UPI0030D4242F
MTIIRPFQASDSCGVRALILPIQRAEFGLPVTLEDQPDLLDIPGWYQQGAGNFWVALDGSEVVGSIALRDIGAGQAALRKMFVAAPWRGAQAGGVSLAQQLLHTLLEWARMQGLREIYLGTTAQFAAAQRFYLKHGFEAIAAADLPQRFPRMRVDTLFFRYRFQASAQAPLE